MPAVRLRTKFLFVIIGLIVFLGAALIFFVQTVVREKLVLEIEKRGIVLAEHASSMNAGAILTRDFRTLQVNLLDLKKEHEASIDYIFVLDRSRRVIAHTFGDRFPTDLKDANVVSPGADYNFQTLAAETNTVVDIAVPLLHNALGEVHVGMKDKIIRQAVNDITTQILSMILLVLIASFIAAFIFSLRITRSISTLAKAAENIGEGDFTQRVEIRTGDEIGDLASSLNDMAESLAKRSEALSREAKLNAALAEVSGLMLTRTTIDDISHNVLKHVMAFTSAKYGFVGYIDPNTGYLICPTLTKEIWPLCGIKKGEFVFKEFRGLWGWVLNNRKPLFTNNPGADPRSSGLPEGHPPIERFASVPALSGRLLIGQIAAANSDRDYSQEDIDVMERFAALYCLAVQRIRMEETIRESNERYRNILDDTQDLIQNVGPDGALDFVNNAWLERMGYSEEEVKTLNVFDIIHPDSLHHCRRLFEQVMSGESIKDATPAYLAKGGEKILLQGNIVPHVVEGRVIGAHMFFKDITEQEQAKEFTRNVLESIDESFVVIDPGFRIISANRAYCLQTGRRHDEIIGEKCHMVSHGLDKPCFDVGEECPVLQTFRSGGSASALHTHHAKDLTPRYVEIKTFPMKNSEGLVTSVIEVINDATEKRKLEDQLRQAQKMESIGTLAGGIAHDFNNILTAIIGYGSLVLMKTATGDPRRQNIEHMLEAADRAAHLTHDLLLFSRKQIADKKSVDLNEIIRRVEKFLKRVIGEDIACSTLLSEGQLPVLADAHQLEQILMNLATNARDAMPQGGVLTITTERIRFDAEFITAHGYGNPGVYSMITISDTGKGMDEITRQRIFEPFFTTKDVGKGTGLGLAVVYGIVKQHEGYINVYSEPGQGSTFKIYLPVIAADALDESISPSAENPVGGAETILLAEDDTLVREMTLSILRDFGYTVIVACDGEEAVNKFSENKDVIQLLLFDLIMPKKTGKDAYDEIKMIKPDIKVLFTSGYAHDMVRQKVVLGDNVEIASKPISPKDLLKKVRNVLDAEH